MDSETLMIPHGGRRPAAAGHSPEASSPPEAVVEWGRGCGPTAVRVSCWLVLKCLPWPAPAQCQVTDEHRDDDDGDKKHADSSVLPGRLAAFGGRSRLVISGYASILKLAKFFQNYHAIVLGG
jgi:hypothetical protein